MYSPLTEENKDVELVELLVEARPLIIVKFIETVLTEPNQGICTFSFSDQIKGLPLYQPLTEENKDVELVKLLVEAKPLIVIKFIETVLTKPTQGICTFSFSNQKGLPLYQPDVKDMNGYESN